MTGSHTADAAEQHTDQDQDRDAATAGSDDESTSQHQEDSKNEYPLRFLNLSGPVKSVVDWLAVFAGIWLMITAVSAIGSGFSMSAGDNAPELFQFAENPIVGLMIGVAATVLTQSSSTSTAITVGMVAGGLPIEIAIPILFGANMGTTVTSTLVSLGMARDREMFRKGFSAASLHDMYNLTALLIFLPLEMMFGLLAKISGWLADQTAGDDAGPIGVVFDIMGDSVDVITGPGTELLEWAVSPLGELWGGIALIVIGVALILAVIRFIGMMMKYLLVGTAEKIFHNAIGRGPVSGVLSGTLITVLVQSSSTTTSLAVPLAATGKFSLKQIFGFIVGANIGTTLTALIAAFGFSGVEAHAALQAAYVHMFYNVLAAITILSIPFLKDVPVWGAKWLGDLGAKNKLYVAAWVLGVFVIIPGLVILLMVVL
ncbi:MAG: Na/Pi symporter [Micrococcus sp.]|nr:Na/Pi symporter [Micrococcus sp.]